MPSPAFTPPFTPATPGNVPEWLKGECRVMADAGCGATGWQNYS